MDPETAKIVQDLLPIQTFLVDWHVRVTWIAFMTLWVFWGLTWFARNAFGGDSYSNPNAIQSSQIGAVHHNNVNGPISNVNDPVNNVNGATTNVNGTATNVNGVTTDVNGASTGYDPEIGNTGATPYKQHKVLLAPPPWSVNVFNRLNRAHDMVRDLVLMLLSVLTLNTFARASTTGVMIIAWIYVAFAFVYFGIEATFEHRYLRLVYSLTFYVLGLAIVGLAFANGFYY